MLYRLEEQGRIAITQPTHAWLSGQLARAWGNERFGEVVPWEEVCLVLSLKVCPSSELTSSLMSNNSGPNLDLNCCSNP